MIDIHSHILPDVDDGARDMAYALDMARIAVADGTTHLFATPHHHSFTRLLQQQVIERVKELQQALDQANIPLTILNGHEVRLYNNVFADWELTLASPLNNSRYVLAEPPFYQFDWEIMALLFEFFERGYTPILAHPERIKPIQQNISSLEAFLKRGGLTQITANSLTGGKYSAVYQTAIEMLEQDMVHIIASDAHNTTYRRPELSAALDVAATIVGAEKAQAMVTTTPMAIVEALPYKP